MRRRPIPTIEESLAALEDLGVTDAPREGPDPQLRGLLDMAAFVAEHRKKIAFPAFTWEDPAFTATDARATWRIAYTAWEGQPVPDMLGRALPRVGPGRLLALDAHAAPDVREFDLSHQLYGRVTLFAWPHKPSQSADLRLHEALDKGWAKTLKAHNLVPGRGLVVLDEDQGLLLSDPRFADIAGLLVLLADGQTHLWWNPVSPHASPDDQYWLAWGDGTGPASGWRELVHVEGDD